jgi:hypothetical protein
MAVNADPPSNCQFSSTKLAFGLLVVGALPSAAIQSGLYRVGMCDPAPLLALLWLGAFSLTGTGFSLYSIWRAEARGGPLTAPLLAALLSLAGIFFPLFLLTR